MKKTHFTAKIAIALVLCLMTVLVASADFAKTNTYAEGTFTDVKADAWYKNDVASAYELGFMNGTGGGKFSPDGNVTVAEAITMASRVHAINNGKTVAKKQGAKNWYDMYVDYAISNGLIADGQFENYDRNAMRYEVAELFAKAMPETHFAPKNDIKDIPDVSETEEYYDALMMLYKAGVVTGSNEYGDFFATNSIKRSETAAIINRVALPENRKTEVVLKEYPARNQAVYLIDNSGMDRVVREISYIASGWTYENPGLSSTERKDFSTNVLSDSSDEYSVTARRIITTQTEGKVVFEAILTIRNSGANILFEDSNGNILFGVSVQDGKYKAIGKTTVDTGVAFADGTHEFYIVLDLDNKKATVVLNGNELGTYEMSDCTDLAGVVYKTTEKGTCTMTLLRTHMYVNYAVNDTFRTGALNQKLYGWDTSENVSLQTQFSDDDARSAAVEGSGKALRKFDAVSGKFVYETFIKVPADQKGTLELKNGDKTAVKVEIGDGKITSEGKMCREYNSSIWTLVRIEGDTASGKALIRINGKKEGTEVLLSENAIDTVVITSSGKGTLWFDDVQVYNVYDYADYVPTPVPVNDDGFYLGMNICSLWREGSHYGWDCISPYEDIEPVLGYYDEGLPEVADWEIKFLVEHGYDFENFCWYYSADVFKNGIKEPRMGYALHDGYMNAKYSDMVKFAIMWENWNAKTSKEAFLNDIWPYWCDWYFTDSRYMRIENKAVVTILNHTRFIEHMGGMDEAKEVISFMKEDIKKLGYDGVIVLCTGSGTLSENTEAEAIGVDGFIAYHLGEAGFDPNHQKKSMNTAFDNGYTPFLPSIGVGFNDIGWTETRTPLITVEDHKGLFEWAKTEYLPKLAKREGQDWMGKFAVANTWNEFGEGHYIFPTNLNKFGYLDAARQVFSTAVGKDDKKHFDIEPTDNQKARLGYLYPAKNIPLRRTHFISDDDAISDNKVIKAWNFENEADCNLWSSLAKTTPTKYDPAEKALTAEAIERDSHIKMVQIPENFFNADEIRYIHIQMKTEVGQNTAVELFYAADEGNKWSSDRRVSGILGKDGEYVDYYFDMSGKSGWTGTIKAIRFDQTNELGKFWIKKIELLSDKAENGYGINVCGVDYNFNSNFVKKAADEVYVGANPTDGFYSLNGFYYEWNRWQGKLMIRTYNGHEFRFTVGSDKVLADGIEKTVSSPIEVVDGLVLIPVMFIYDNAEYDYEKVDGGLKVNIKGVDVEKIIASRKPYEFEFNVPGDNEEWKMYGAAGGAASGTMYMQTTFNGSRYDPQIVYDKAQIKTAFYNRAEARIKAIYSDESNDNIVTFYFATTDDPNPNQAKCVIADLAKLTPDEEGFYTVTFDLASNPLWASTAIQIRFDPPNRAGEYFVDYIRVLVDPEKEEEFRNASNSVTTSTPAGTLLSSIGFDNAERFTTYNIGNISVNGSFKGVSTTADPNVACKQKLNLDASAVKTIRIFAKIPKGKTAEVFFTTDKDTEFTSGKRYIITSGSDDFAEYTIHTSANSNWKDKIVSLRFDPVVGENLEFEWKAIEFYGDADASASVETNSQTPVSSGENVVHRITLDSKEKLATYNIGSISVNGTFKGVSTTADPNITFKDNVNLQASEIKTIRIIARIPRTKSAEVFFTTTGDADKAFTSAKRFIITSSTDDFAEYIITTSSNSNWKDEIISFRFDPVVGEGLGFEVKSIEFCR